MTWSPRVRTVEVSRALRSAARPRRAPRMETPSQGRRGRRGTATGLGCARRGRSDRRSSRRAHGDRPREVWHRTHTRTRGHHRTSHAPASPELAPRTRHARGTADSTACAPGGRSPVASRRYIGRTRRAPARGGDPVNVPSCAPHRPWRARPQALDRGVCLSLSGERGRVVP